MVLDFFRTPRETGLEHVENQVSTMLTDCRHNFDTAMNALVGGTRPDAVRSDVRTTDLRINEAEREIRRELVVHISVQGASEVSTILAYMLVSRMLERIGDNAKNIFDLGLEGVDLSAAPDADQLRALRDEISRMFSGATEILGDRDSERARSLLTRADEMLTDFDRRVSEQVHSTESASEAVPRALLYRYLKRIVANLANILSSVVLPVDQMDYYSDEVGEADRTQ